MKTNWLPVFLTALLCLMAVIAFGQEVRFFFMMRQLQGVRGELATVELLQYAVRGLTEDCLVYSQTNPALLPLLQQFDVHGSKPPTPSPAVSGSRPGGR